MAVEYKYVSADNHIDSWWLPKNLYQERLPANLRESGPRVIEEADGNTFWFWENKKRRESADNPGPTNARLLKQYYKKVTLPPGTMPPTNPKMVLEHLDMSSIYAANFFSDTRKWAFENRELNMAVTRVYNDYVMELNATNPERLMYMPQMPTWSSEWAPAELKRMIAKGVKAVEFHCFDLDKPIYSGAWDEFFDIASAAGVPLCTHIGDTAGTPYWPNERGSSWAGFTMAPMSNARFIPQFIFSGAFERYPKLQVSFAECRIGWLPFLFSWMDRQVEIRPPDPTVTLSMMPIDYVKRNMTFTFEEDRIGARMVQYDWANLKECAVWGGDYPHDQGTWPEPEGFLESLLPGLTDAERRYITCEHSAKIFNVKMPQPATA